MIVLKKINLQSVLEITAVAASTWSRDYNSGTLQPELQWLQHPTDMWLPFATFRVSFQHQNSVVGCMLWSCDIALTNHDDLFNLAMHLTLYIWHGHVILQLMTVSLMELPVPVTPYYHLFSDCGLRKWH